MPKKITAETIEALRAVARLPGRLPPDFEEALRELLLQVRPEELEAPGSLPGVRAALMAFTRLPLPQGPGQPWPHGPRLLAVLRGLLAQLDPPDCDCEVLPVCRTRGRPGCRTFREERDCDCVCVPGPACPHQQGFDWDEAELPRRAWEWLLRAAEPYVYGDPPPPTAAATLPLPREQWVGLLASRAGPKDHGEGWARGVVALRHPGDTDTFAQDGEFSLERGADGRERVIETRGANHGGGEEGGDDFGPVGRRADPAAQAGGEDPAGQRRLRRGSDGAA